MVVSKIIMLNSKQKIISDLEQNKIKADQQIIALQSKVTELETEIGDFKDKNITDINSLKKSHEDDYNHLKETDNKLILDLKEEISSKNKELDKKELKKLARAYEDQEVLYKEDVLFWFRCVSFVSLSIFIVTALAIYLSHGKPWHERIEYYLIDLILFTVLYFCSSQYSDYTKLRNDYANRKTLAQSFGNILNSLEENNLVKDKFIEKTTDILCAPVIISKKEAMLSKGIMKEMKDVIKIIKD